MVAEPTVYVPATQMPTQLVNLAHVWFQPSWIVRTKAKSPGITQQMQQALASVDPDLPVSGFYGMNDVLAEALLLQHVEAGLLAVLAGLALLLSSVASTDWSRTWLINVLTNSASVWLLVARCAGRCSRFPVRASPPPGPAWPLGCLCHLRR